MLQEAKYRPSPQRCGSLHTVPHTIKLGAGVDFSWYPTGRLLCPAWAKAIICQGDFWQHQTILSAFLSSHLYKFSCFFHISCQDDSWFLFGWFSYPKFSWSFPDYCLIQSLVLSVWFVGWVFLASILSNSFEYSTHIHCLHSHILSEIVTQAVLPRESH